MSRGELAAAVVAGALVGYVASGSPKAQAVRLVDVVALGPLMIYAATLERGGDRPARLARLALAGAGAATIAYNARNYLCLS